MKDTPQVEEAEKLIFEDEDNWFDCLINALGKVIILIFCSFVAGIGFAFGSRWAWIAYEAFVKWCEIQ